MSASPQALAQMLLSQQSGGSQPLQSTTNGTQAGADLMRKIMLIQTLKNQQPQQPGQGQPTLPGSPNGMTQGGLNASPALPGQMIPQQMMQLQNPQTGAAQNA